MKTILIIDDEKRWQDVIPDWTVDGEDIASGKTLVITARNYYDGIFYLQTYKGMFDEVHIDFQLGIRGDDETGMDVLSWLEYNPEFIPARMDSCSGNSDNAAAMRKKMSELIAMRGASK